MSGYELVKLESNVVICKRCKKRVVKGKKLELCRNCERALVRSPYNCGY
jgi:predicted amidophosphoribosyltransferase